MPPRFPRITRLLWPLFFLWLLLEVLALAGVGLALVPLVPVTILLAIAMLFESH